MKNFDATKVQLDIEDSQPTPPSAPRKLFPGLENNDESETRLKHPPMPRTEKYTRNKSIAQTTTFSNASRDQRKYSNSSMSERESGGDNFAFESGVGAFRVIPSDDENVIGHYSLQQLTPSLNPPMPLDLHTERRNNRVEIRMGYRMCLFFALALIVAVLGIVVVATVVHDGNASTPNFDNERSTDFPTGSPLVKHHCDMEGLVLDNQDQERIRRTQRYNDLKLVLESAVKGNDTIIFNRPCEPHDMALTWLADIDTLQLTSEINIAVCQRFAVALLYFSTSMQKATAMPLKKNDDHWLSAENECL
eukprot:scaffold7523_cov47-Attheya_sp.AAC.1